MKVAILSGSRIKRLRPYIGDEPFMLTWGDGEPIVSTGPLDFSELAADGNDSVPVESR
jgi:hypothetical protein